MAREKEETIVEHLTEFRSRLMAVLVCFLFIFIVGLFLAPKMYELLTGHLHQRLLILGPDDILWIYVQLASLLAFVMALPFTAYQLWAFVRPALSPLSNWTIFIYILSIFTCFVGGMAFGFFLVTPSLLHVLLSLGEGLFLTQLTAKNYLQFVWHTTLPLAILFEFPVMVAFLTSISILSPAFLVQYRRYAYFILLCLAVILTPADFISDLAMTIPLIGIYEISILVSRWIIFQQKKEKKDGNYS